MSDVLRSVPTWAWLAIGFIAWVALGMVVGFFVGGAAGLGDELWERAVRDEPDGDWLLVEFDRIEWPWRGEDRTAA